MKRSQAPFMIGLGVICLTIGGAIVLLADDLSLVRRGLPLGVLAVLAAAAGVAALIYGIMALRAKK